MRGGQRKRRRRRHESSLSVRTKARAGSSWTEPVVSMQRSATDTEISFSSKKSLNLLRRGNVCDVKSKVSALLWTQ